MASSSASYGASGITWGTWRQLPNGQWHREGQDPSGNWYEDNQDVEPRSPRDGDSMEDPGDSGLPYQIEEFDSIAMDSSPGHYPRTYPGYGTSVDYGGYDQVTKHKNKSKHTRNPEQAEASRHTYTRDKSSRSSKSEVRGYRGHGKSTSSSRTDAKGKGREIDMQPVHLPTADDDDAPDFSQNLQDVADIYQTAVGESSSSSSAILDLVPFEPAESYEQLDEVPELPRPSSYSRPTRSHKLLESPDYNEDLTQYVVEHARKFRFGTVFKTMWSEPMGGSRLSRHNKDPVGTGTSLSEFGQRNYNGTLLYEGVRCFIVIDGNENGARNGNSICVPIATYKRQGCTKHGVKPSQHGIIYTQDKTPMLLRNEPELGIPPIRLVVSPRLQGIEKLAPESRVNYSKHVTIEHSTNVHIIGQIHPDDLGILERGVDNLWEMRVNNRKRDKKREREASVKEQNLSRNFKSTNERSRPAETSLKLPERHAPDRMQQEGHRPDHSPVEHLGSTHSPVPSGLRLCRDEGAEQDDASSLSQTLVNPSPGIISEEPQKPHLRISSDLWFHQNEGAEQDNNSSLSQTLVNPSPVTVLEEPQGPYSHIPFSLWFPREKGAEQDDNSSLSQTLVNPSPAIKYEKHQKPYPPAISSPEVYRAVVATQNDNSLLSQKLVDKSLAIKDEEPQKPYSPILSSLNRYRAVGAKQADDSSLSQPLVDESPVVIYKESQEPHASAEAHSNVSDTQEFQEEPDSRLDSRPISNNAIHNQCSPTESTEVHSAGIPSLPNSPDSPSSSICLTETPPDTSATGPHLTTLQRRQLIVQQLIAYVNFLFQTRAQSQGEGTRAHTEFSGGQTSSEAKSSEAENQTTQSSSGAGQPIPTVGKRKASDQPSEEENDEEEEPPGRARKGKQKDSPAALFACPYIKRDAAKASCRNNNGWPSVHRVKEHLYRHHRQAIHCPRCFITFKDEGAVATHLREQEPLQCVRSGNVSMEGFDKNQEKELKSRKGLSDLSECEKWEKIYMILFPDQDQIPSPYFEPLAGLIDLRRKLPHQLAHHIKKKLKGTHQKESECELNEEFFEGIMDDVFRICLSNPSNRPHNVEGNVVAAKNSSAQSSCQPETSAARPPCDLAFDGYTNEPFLPVSLQGLDDLHMDFYVGGPILSMYQTSGPSNSGMDYAAADPYYQQDPDANKPISDSGIGTSLLGQGPPECLLLGGIWESAEEEFNKDDEDPNSWDDSI